MKIKKIALGLICSLALFFAFVGVINIINGKQIEITPETSEKLTQSEIALLSQQAKSGNKEAAYRLYLYYEEFLQNHKEAIYWLNAAANLEHENAQALVAYTAYAEDNLAKASYWFWKLAKQGKADGMLELTIFLKNTEDALPVFVKEARMGNGKASYCLYKYYEYIEGVTQISAKALNATQSKSIDWLVLSANEDNALAQYELGQKYEKRHQIKSAIFWYRKASKNGNLKAAVSLKSLNNPFNIFLRFIKFE